MGSNYFNSERLSYAFCDVPKFGFYGNASIEDMDRQIRTIIEGESVRTGLMYTLLEWENQHGMIMY